MSTGNRLGCSTGRQRRSMNLTPPNSGATRGTVHRRWGSFSVVRITRAGSPKIYGGSISKGRLWCRPTCLSATQLKSALATFRSDSSRAKETAPRRLSRPQSKPGTTAWKSKRTATTHRNRTKASTRKRHISFSTPTRSKAPLATVAHSTPATRT